MELAPDGAALRVEALASEVTEDRDGMLIIPSSDTPMGEDVVRALRAAGQR